MVEPFWLVIAQITTFPGTIYSPSLIDC